MYEVLMKNEMNDDTEILFSGYKDECRVFIQGYIGGVLNYSSYSFVDLSQNVPVGEEVLLFHSPLVSQYDFRLWIDKAKPEEEDDNIPF